MSRPSHIPRFPAFKRLDLADRHEVERFTTAFAPYSDFNFVSLYAWDTDGFCELSWLYDNLVVKLKDYGGDDVFVTFLGTHLVAETAATLLTYAERHGLQPALRLVPEVVAERAADAGVAVTEDPGSFDYVLSVPDLVELSGGKFRKKRNEIRGFERKHAPEFRVADLCSRAVQQEIVETFLLWSENRQRFGLGETRNELLALRRALTVACSDDRMVGFAVYVDDEMRGFSVNEVLDDGYAIGHFWKADQRLAGIYAYLMHQACRHLGQRGCRFFNIEQDLGKGGLAQSKRLYRPHHLLRKYVITAPVPAPVAPHPTAANGTPAVERLRDMALATG